MTNISNLCRRLALLFCLFACVGAPTTRAQESFFEQVRLAGEFELAACIRRANENPDARYAVELLADIHLTSPLPILLGKLKIFGNSHVIYADRNFRIFHVKGELSLEDLVLRGGKAQGGNTTVEIGGGA